MADYTIKRNDQGSTVEILLEERDPITGEWVPTNLSAVTAVKLLMKSATASVFVVGAVGSGAGVVSFTWGSLDLDFAGTYRVEVELARGTAIETVPNAGYLEFVVSEDLG
jgi:hypothetical protein